MKTGNHQNKNPFFMVYGMWKHWWNEENNQLNPDNTFLASDQPEGFVRAELLQGSPPPYPLTNPPRPPKMLILVVIYKKKKIIIIIIIII